MSSRQYLIDAATRHQIFLQRYGAGQSKEAIRVLNQLRRNINARLMQEPTDFQRNRLVRVLADIDALARESFNTIGRKLAYDAQDLARVEAGFSVELFNKATAHAEWIIPADATLIGAVMSSAMPVSIKSAITIDEALRQFSNKKTIQITRMISDGVTLGDTTPTIAKNVGMLIDTLNRRQLDSLARTITNHAASVTRNIVYDDNSDIVDGYQWIATLDSRTTLICGARDNKIYKINMGPMPPAHWGCRSTTIPKIKPEYDIGAGQGAKMRPAVGAKGAGRVKGGTGYDGWLRKQPKPFVDEALGVERSKLFRSGKLTIDKFVDPTGRVFTLAELERMNPFVFME